MCGRRSRVSLKRLGVTLLLLLAVSLPCFSLDEAESQELNRILTSLETSYRNIQALYEQQDRQISGLQSSLNLLQQDTTRFGQELNSAMEMQESLTGSMETLEMSSRSWEEPLQSLESSLNAMEGQVRLYKGLAIGGIVVSVSLGLTIGLVVLFNSLGWLS